ncbi:DivIVA domain-containing protein [Arthrospiribacter ruber]|uniref:DivIVA domain-containing protein n=1 Tax=Arthrospiribacter ruber TaxID=2487934 RepID=A0A951MF67_9BACT|nr:DivIVA domain-containing protein [Arthrospiribacter ruber]MBW3469677.1 DivIVA domain-containing protein [Arthrospiribacter ruber]
MKITPIEIRDKSFEKNFRGYDKDEVTDFLKFLSAEFETLLKENEELTRKLAASEKEATKLKEVEESLFRTLKTAEDTGAAMIEEATKSSEEIMSEAHQNAETMVQDAQRQAQNLIESAEEKGKQMMDDLRSDVKGLVEDYSSLLAQRDMVLRNLKALAEDINDNISVSQEAFKKINVDVHAQMVEKLSKSNAFSMAQIAEVQKSSPKFEVKNEEKIEEKPIETTVAQAAPEEIPTPQAAVDTPDEVTEEIEAEPVKAEVPDEEVKEKEVQVEVVAKEPSQEEEKPKKEENKGGSFFDQLD